MTAPAENRVPRKSMAPMIIGIVAIVMILVIIGGGIVFSLVVWTVHRDAQRQAMVIAYDQRKTAIFAFGERAKQHVPTRQNCDQVMSDIRQINLAGCPTDFQEKFLASTKAFGQLMVDFKSDTGSSGALKIIGQIRMLNTKPLTDEVKELDEAGLAFQMSELELEQCAQSYGLVFSPNK